MSEAAPAQVREQQPLTGRQHEVLSLIARFYSATGETPSVLFIARRLDVHHSTIQEHLQALFSKGWLTAPSPDGLRCPHVD